MFCYLGIETVPFQAVFTFFFIFIYLFFVVATDNED